MEKDIPLLQKDRVLKVDKLQNEISLHSAHGMKPRALAHGMLLNTTHDNEIQPVLVLATIVNGKLMARQQYCQNHFHSGQDDGKLMARQQYCRNQSITLF